MYSKMNYDIDHEYCETKSKKKYELSLKREKDKNLEKYVNEKDESDDPSSSQNIMLRVSDSFVVEDTQENVKNMESEKRGSLDDEIIIISDSSEDENPPKYQWTKLKTSELLREGKRNSVSPPSTIYTIKSSGSEDEIGKVTIRKLDKPKKYVLKKEAEKKCSIMYTSDDSECETESRNIFNKENNQKIQMDRAIRKNVIPDSDDSLFSFEKMKGILTENGRNIYESKIPKKTNEKIQDLRKTPQNFDYPCDKKSSAKSLKEINRKIEEWQINPEFTKNVKNVSGSLNNLNRSPKKIEASRKPNDFSKNKTGSLSNLKETNKKNDEPWHTPNFSKIMTKQTGSLNDLKGTDKEFEEYNKISEFPNVAKKDTTSLKNLRETNKRFEETSKQPVSAKISSRTTVLSNKDMRNILKVINSKRAIFQSPREIKKPENSESPVEEDSEKENAVSSSQPELNLKKNETNEKPVVIAETDSEESANEIIRGSRVDLSKPYKTHLTRFLDPGTNYDSPEGMSERKKLEIAHWLMENSPDERSESSISNVSPSNKNSPSSGNSSLERLEMNYETPNNRYRIRSKIDTDEKKNNPLNSAKSTKSTKSRQTTIDNFIKKSDDGKKKIFTPVTPIRRNKEISDNYKTTEDLGIMDCADILDNLYGDVWRSKANDLLPMTEPRKKTVSLRDKGVQTERKMKPKKRITESSDCSSLEDGFDTFVRNLEPNLNSTKKPGTRKTHREKRNLAKDLSPSSESGGETTYLTALTNPRISNDYKIRNRPTPLSLNMQRAIAICDSDTEDENEKHMNNRKVLSFSDDESSSNTSEYDPNDVIPTKIKTKNQTGVTNPRSLTKNTKTPIAISTNPRSVKTNTFLASLSSIVPLTEIHPDAKKYRQDYKNTKEELCKRLYKLYNEKIFDNKLPSDMSIEWNVRMRGTAGFCYNKRSIKALGGITRSSRIVLATKILDTPDRLRDTLVHEMCHAAAWLINDISDGHGPFWKAWATKAMKAFPELPAIKRCHDYKITTKFTYRCTGCGYSVGRHSKSLDVERKRCGHCYGKFELLINKVTKTGEIESKTPVSKKPTGFALFVKENYSSVKKERKGVAHKEVMQILGQQFSAIKIGNKNNNVDENHSNNVSND